MDFGPRCVKERKYTAYSASGAATSARVGVTRRSAETNDARSFMMSGCGGTFEQYQWTVVMLVVNKLTVISGVVAGKQQAG